MKNAKKAILFTKIKSASLSKRFLNYATIRISDMGFITSKLVILIFIAGVLVLGSVIYVRNSAKEPSYGFVIAKRGNLIQEVSVTGRVKAVLDVDLAFERGGKVLNAYVKISDIVEVGQELVNLDISELQTQLNQARADFDYASSQFDQAKVAADIERTKLAQLKRGTRAEEVRIAETKASNAEKALGDSKINLKNIKLKADADIDEDYDNALNAVASSLTVGIDALFTLTNIQFAHFYGGDQIDLQISDAKADAVFALLGGVNGGRFSNDSISKLSGGAKAVVAAAEETDSHEDIDNALLKVSDGLEKVKKSLDLITIDLLSSTEKTSLNTAKTNINSEIATISGKVTAIEVQKASNSSAISTTEGKVNDSQNSLVSARDELALKKAGAAYEDIRIQEYHVAKAEANIASEAAKVNKAEALVENYEAQIGKTVVRSPISGIVTKQDAKVGEIVSANQVIVSVMSGAAFEVGANVAEVDIAKISLGDAAKITLDSYGNGVIFEATVVAIDPAEIIIEGVATYKVTFSFKNEDSRVKSGMTANVNVLTDSRENVIYAPQRAVIQKNGDKIVRVVKGGTINEVMVETGLYASDGSVEIIAGINEGDKVITFVEEK